MPPWVATIFTFIFGRQIDCLTCSHALPVANGILPAEANPAAVPIISCSDTPILKNLSGNFFLNFAVLVELARSASRTTISLFSVPSSIRTSPYTSLVPSILVTLTYPQFLHCPLILIPCRSYTMILYLVLHKGDTLTFYSMGNNHCRFPFDFLCLIKGVNNCFNIMPIDFYYMPAKRLPFFRNRVNIHDLFICSIYLQAIIVHYRTEIIYLVMGCSHCRLPDLS